MIDEVYRHCGQKETVHLLRPRSWRSASARLQGRHFVRQGRHGRAGVQREVIDETAPTRARSIEQQYNDGLITAGREVQQGGRRLVEGHRPRRRRNDEGNLGGRRRIRNRPRSADQLDLHDGAFRRARLAAADEAARRHARPDGQAVGRDHRDARSSRTSRKACRCSSTSTRPTAPARDWPTPRSKTANSGYLTRRLVDVAQDCIITTEDCGTKAASRCAPIIDAGTVVASLASASSAAPRRRTSSDPASGKVIIKRGTQLTEDLRSKRSTSASVQEVRIRSVLTCEAPNGVCGACYGRDLARGTPVNMGEAVGVIAAQSIGEPGTQLTMRTFHIGGAAQISEQSFIEVELRRQDQDQGQPQHRQELRRRR